MQSTLTIKNVFGIVILSLISALLVGTMITSAGLEYLPEGDVQFINYLALFVGQGFMMIPLLLFLTARKEPLLDRLRIKNISWPVVSSTVIFSVGLIIWVDEFDRLASLIFTPPDFMNEMGVLLQFDSFGMALFIIFGIVILAPFGEEILFRGFLQKFLEEHWQDVTRAVLVTSLFFALIHLNPFWLIQIYILGVMLGYLAWKTGSIWAGFILHVMNNFLALMFTNYDESLSGFYTWNGHVAPWILLIGILCIYYGFTRLNQTAKVLT